MKQAIIIATSEIELANRKQVAQIAGFADNEVIAAISNTVDGSDITGDLKRSIEQALDAFPVANQTEEVTLMIWATFLPGVVATLEA